MPGDSVMVNKLGFFSSDSLHVHGAFYNFKLSAAHTQLTALTDTFDNNYSDTPVSLLQRDTLDLSWNYNQWNAFIFDSSFKYNGVDNFIFEIQWNGCDGGSNYSLAWYPADTHRILNGFIGLPSGGVFNFMNSLQIHYANYGVEENTKNLPLSFNISPNPFTTSTIIKFFTPNFNPLQADLTLSIYDASGKLVKSFSPIPNPHSLTNNLTWDGSDNSGNKLTNGIYFAKLKSGNLNLTKKITLIR